jgi:hypothetical protein
MTIPKAYKSVRAKILNNKLVTIMAIPSVVANSRRRNLLDVTLTKLKSVAIIQNPEMHRNVKIARPKTVLSVCRVLSNAR